MSKKINVDTAEEKVPDTVQDLAHYFFHQGTNFNSYDYLGVHKVSVGYVFRVWAPNAHEIFVVGDFNSWERRNPMTRITEMGVWECLIETENSLEDQKI